MGRLSESINMINLSPEEYTKHDYPGSLVYTFRDEVTRLRKILRAKDRAEERLDLILKGKICPYCKKPSEYINSKEVYGKDFGMMYRCKGCNAHVGVHKGSNLALGRLADPILREEKRKAHDVFDKIWRLGIMDRTETYEALSAHLGLDRKYTHIGMFGLMTCQRTVDWAKNILAQQEGDSPF